MGKKKGSSTFVSALGTLMGIVIALIAAIKRRGGSEADLYRLATPDGEGLIEDLADLIVRSGCGDAQRVFVVRVNYDHSVEYAIRMGRYGQKCLCGASERCPSQETGTRDIAIKLFDFLLNDDLHIGDIVAELDAHGFRPATLKELLAFGERYPVLLREIPVIALGSVFDDPRGGLCYPFISMVNSVRSLDLCFLSDVFPAGGIEMRHHALFAGVRK